MPPKISVTTPGADNKIKRVVMATLTGDSPQFGMEQAFFGVFGRQNVHAYDFVDRAKTGLPKQAVNDEFYKAAATFAPDWIWLQVQNSGIIDAKTIERLKKDLPNVVVSHWMGDMRKDVSPYMSSICKATHLTLASSVGQLQSFRDAGAARAEYCPVALDWDDDVQGKSPWNDQPYDADVVFCGNYYGQDFPGGDDRLKALKALRDVKIKFGVVGNGWGNTPWVPVLGKSKRFEQYHVYRNCKIVLSINNFNEVERYYSNRMFVALASGKPVVAHYVPRMEVDFTENEHCLWYKSIDELIEKVGRLLTDEAERERIGRNGRALAIRKHTWFQRVLDVLPVIEEIRTSLRK